MLTKLSSLRIDFFSLRYVSIYICTKKIANTNSILCNYIMIN